jgi:hypothetical protein
MWRKKVDNSIFEGETVIPMSFVDQWDLKNHFKDTGVNVETWPVQIKFASKFYDANIFYRHPTKVRSSEQHKIIFKQGNLIEDLKKAFLMSHIRWLEVELRKQGTKKSAEATKETQRETPFWEFLDIEFDQEAKKFIFTAHYTQPPYFPEVFKHLIGSPKLKQIESSIFNNFEKIINQDWKEKQHLTTELGAKNVIYILLDDINKLIYVGETGQDLKIRLADKEHYKNAGIPHWTHYRFEALPSSIGTKARKEIEDMTIRAYATLFSNTKNVKSFKISDYKLVNRKIKN